MAATSQTILDSERLLIIKLQYDGVGGESAVTKVDVSTLAAQTRTGLACTEVAIERIWHASSSEINVDLEWDATANVIAWTLTGDGYIDFRSIGPITNNSAAGKTGDLAVSTVGTAVAASRYAIMLSLRKIYQ